jgi:hypothetical protein
MLIPTKPYQHISQEDPWSQVAGRLQEKSILEGRHNWLNAPVVWKHLEFGLIKHFTIFLLVIPVVCLRGKLPGKAFSSHHFLGQRGLVPTLADRLLAGSIVNWKLSTALLLLRCRFMATVEILSSLKGKL